MNTPRSTGDLDLPQVHRPGSLAGSPSHNERAFSPPRLVADRSDEIESGSAKEEVDELNRAGSRIQELVQQIDALPNSPARVLFQECLESVLAFYGHGLKRILEIVANSGAGGQKIYGDLIHDHVVRGLLLIHDLHPVDIETRLREALDKVRPYLKSHGGNVELISLKNEVAQLRLVGTCKSCASSTVTLELAIRHAIEEACPDLIGFEVDGAPTQSSGATETAGRPGATVDWIDIDSARQLGDESGMSVRVGELRLIVCRVNGTFYAYRNNCPACNMPLNAGILDSGFLRCGLGHRYDARQAGRSPDNPNVHLDPFPILIRDDRVEVAVMRRNDSPVRGEAGFAQNLDLKQ
jgi:Fe-S cluster biogenesis protein NfuA/nitrite reductase/ring-hydroxylating ferredoxin subunit